MKEPIGEQMPPQPYIARWLRCVFHVHDPSQSEILIPLNFRGPITRPSEPDVIALAQDVWTGLQGQIRGCMSNLWFLDSVDITDRYGVGGAYANYAPAGPFPGSLANDPVPANVADVISWKTGQAGRRYRGRTYMPGSTDTSSTGSIFSTAYTLLVGAFATAASAYAGTPTTPVDLAVVSITDLAIRLITSYTIDNVADSQRRRLPGRGF